MTEAKKESPLLEGIKNAKTTGVAIAAFVSFVATKIATPLLDGDPETAADWLLLVPAILALVAFFYAADAAKKADK